MFKRDAAVTLETECKLKNPIRKKRNLINPQDVMSIWHSGEEIEWYNIYAFEINIRLLDKCEI